jgi:hypothetical protein
VLLLVLRTVMRTIVPMKELQGLSVRPVSGAVRKCRTENGSLRDDIDAHDDEVLVRFRGNPN